MLRYLLAVSFALTALMTAPPTLAETIVVYSGRSKTLVGPIVKQFTKQTGIKVNVKYGKTSPLALALIEEGDRSPADVFWAQESGTLGFMANKSRFAKLPGSVTSLVPSDYVGQNQDWVGVSGRLRVIAYAPDRVKAQEIPASIFDLIKPQYKGRVGWAPANSSFQAFVTALRKTHGQDKAKQWLQDMKANGAKPFPKNTAIVLGLANGEIDLGLPNHYYLLRFKASDKKFPVEQTQFVKGDIGNMNNLAGVGILKSSRKQEAAAKFVEYLLSAQAQQYFVGETFEIPVNQNVIYSGTKGFVLDEVVGNLPQQDLNDLADLEGTLALLREVGLI